MIPTTHYYDIDTQIGSGSAEYHLKFKGYIHYLLEEGEEPIPADAGDDHGPVFMHCETGPARYMVGRYDGSYYLFQLYMINNKFHRYDGPSKIEIYSENKEELWHINGKKIDGALYQKWLAEQGMDIENLSEEDKLLIDMKWA